MEIGAWTNSDAISFDLLIDKLSIVDSASAGGGAAIRYVSDNSIGLNNYPNPVSSTSTIACTIHESGNVQPAVYNVLGEQAATLVKEFQTPGTYRIQFDASQYRDNVYYYSLKINNKSATRKMLIIKQVLRF